MKTAVLTGATGFLGFSLLKELVNNNIFVYVLCRPNSMRLARLNGLSGIKIIEIVFESLDSKFNEIENCDVFYHLAWEGERNNFEQQYKNIDITIKCLKFASKLGCKRFICTGSQAEYGETNTLITEESPLLPVTSYGTCKVAAYYATKDLALRLRIDHIWIRIFSAYGPNDNSNTLIMTLVKELRSKNVFSLISNGKHIWNYLFEEDVARALFLFGLQEGISGVYNLASKKCRYLKDYIEEVKNIIAPNGKTIYGNEVSPINLDVSIEKTLNVIGEFEKTDFAKGIKKFCF